MALQFYALTSYMLKFQLICILISTWNCPLENLVILISRLRYHDKVIISVSTISNIWHPYILFDGVFVQIFCPVLYKELLYSYWILRVLYIFWIRVFYQMDDLPRLSLSLYLSVHPFKQCLLKNKVLNICSQASCWVVCTHSLPLDLGWSAVCSWPSCMAPPHVALTHLTLEPADGAVFRPHLSDLAAPGTCLTSPGTLLPLSCLCDHSFSVSFHWAVLPRKCPLTPYTCSPWWDLPLHLSHDHLQPVTPRSLSAAQLPHQLRTHSPSCALQLL